MTDDLNEIKRELRDLKTAQAIPSTITAYTFAYTIAASATPPETATLTINYEAGEGEPITIFDNEFSAGIYLLPYDSATQTQAIFIDNMSILENGFRFELTSNRKITAIT